MSNPIWQWSATDTAAAIRDGKVTSQEATAAHIERMNAVNQDLNAVVIDLSDQAMKAAREADAAVARGETLDLLHGVPITIKINVDYEGQANSNGVVAMKDLIAPSDSPVVRNLKGAGAITIGLTNTPEFSLRGVTDNPLHGLTLNPWDAEITCGGSSGGAGSALAAGIGCIAHGNDIGGSLRWPAHCNGVATMRPTLGRVPTYNESGGDRPLAAQLFAVQGPMARSVADLRLGLEVMSRRDPRDPWWVPAPLELPKAAGPIKVGLASVPADMNPDAEVVALYRKAADHLANEGYIVEEITVPDLQEGWQNWANLLIGEVRLLQEKTIRPITSPDFNTALDAYLEFAEELDAVGYVRALTDRTLHLRNWMLLLEEYPVILAPVSVQRTVGARADLGGAAAVKDMWGNGGRYIGAINHVGLPSAVVPVGLVGGHPVGVQLIASRYREDVALDAAQAIERHVGMLVQQLWAREV